MKTLSVFQAQAGYRLALRSNEDDRSQAVLHPIIAWAVCEEPASKHIVLEAMTMQEYVNGTIDGARCVPASQFIDPEFVIGIVAPGDVSEWWNDVAADMYQHECDEAKLIDDRDLAGKIVLTMTPDADEHRVLRAASLQPQDIPHETTSIGGVLIRNMSAVLLWLATRELIRIEYWPEGHRTVWVITGIGQHVLTLLENAKSQVPPDALPTGKLDDNGASH